MRGSRNPRPLAVLLPPGERICKERRALHSAMVEHLLLLTLNSLASYLQDTENRAGTTDGINKPPTSSSTTITNRGKRAIADT